MLLESGQSAAAIGPGETAISLILVEYVAVFRISHLTAKWIALLPKPLSKFLCSTTDLCWVRWCLGRSWTAFLSEEQMSLCGIGRTGGK